jgi:selenoprotein W-related protein
LTDEILKDRNIEQFIGTWRMIPSTGGVFEVTVNGDLVYSKKATGRHANPGEIKAAIERKLREARAASGSQPGG